MIGGVCDEISEGRHGRSADGEDGAGCATARECRHFYGLDLSIPVRLANLSGTDAARSGFSSISKPVST